MRGSGQKQSANICKSQGRCGMQQKIPLVMVGQLSHLAALCWLRRVL